MKRIIILTVAIFTTVAIFATVEKKGVDIFLDKKCNTCHSIKSIELPAKKTNAYDLSDVGNINDFESLSSYLKKEAYLRDKYHPIKVNIKDDDYKILIDWLLTLKDKSYN